MNCEIVVLGGNTVFPRIIFNPFDANTPINLDKHGKRTGKRELIGARFILTDIFLVSSRALVI